MKVGITISFFVWVFIFSSLGVSSANASTYCKSYGDRIYISYRDTCKLNYKEISGEEFCEMYSGNVEYNKYCWQFPEFASNPNESMNLNKVEELTNDNKIANRSDKDVCLTLIKPNGLSRTEGVDKVIAEAKKRELSINDCKKLTGRFTKEEKKYIENQIRVAQKKARIKQLKLDCEDIGFNDGT